MSTIDCGSCNDLREAAPSFVQNGVTSTVAASLKNNTGFNPSLTVLHDNCQDLNDANDCLIGRMSDEVKAYDVCDWKKFMGKYIPNNYELLKAIIAGDCGQWAMLDALCQRLNYVYAPPLDSYAVFFSNPDARSYGVIPEKAGQPVIVGSSFRPEAAQCGIQYGKRITEDCDGRQMITEWMIPYFYSAEFGVDIDDRDVIWYITKTAAQRDIGVTESFWTYLRDWTKTFPAATSIGDGSTAYTAGWTLEVRDDIADEPALVVAYAKFNGVEPRAGMYLSPGNIREQPKINVSY